MKTAKNILTITLAFISAGVFAALKPAVNNATGDMVYTQTFELSGNITDETAYEMAESWFGQTAKFTSQNAEAGNSYSQNRSSVDQAFTNNTPLQSLDPEGKRIAAKGLMKYSGGANSTINLMYIEYYVVIEISEHQLTATISNIKYHHFNKRTYGAQPIYNWNGGKPFDSADKVGNLMPAQGSNRDINGLSEYINLDITRLMADLGNHLKTKKALV